MRIDSRFQNLSNAGFQVLSDSFNTITLKMLALKVDDVGERLRTRPELITNLRFLCGGTQNRGNIIFYNIPIMICTNQKRISNCSSDVTACARIRISAVRRLFWATAMIGIITTCWNYFISVLAEVNSGNINVFSRSDRFPKTDRF